GSQDCWPPAASFRRRRLARKPYMRSEAGPLIRLLSAAGGASSRAQGRACGEEPCLSESRARQRGLDPGGPWRGPEVGSPLSRSAAAPTLAPGGPRGPVQTPVRGAPGFSGIQFGAGTGLPARLPRGCGPGDAGVSEGSAQSLRAPRSLPRERPPAGERSGGGTPDRRPAPAPRGGEGAPSCSLGRGPLSPPRAPQQAFNLPVSASSGSPFGLAGERGKAEGFPPAREAEDTGARACPARMGPARTLDMDISLPALVSRQLRARGLRLDPGGQPRLQGEPLSVLDTDAASSCSPDPPKCEGAASRWDPLLRKCEPLLQGCLLSHRRRLEVNALRLKLQKLLEKAVEEDDYDKAETFKHRLDDLEKEEEEEESGLCFQLPSRQPALFSLLVHLGAQAEAALCRAAQQAGSEDTQAPLRVEPPAEDPPCASITRRDRLLHEKQQLQEEMAALQARMSALAAKDQQLRREMELQQQLLRWRDCDLRPLLDGLAPGELQEVHQAARDTLALAGQSPLPAGPPEAVRSLQERLKPLHWSLREIAAKVCRTQRLCGSLRRSLHEIETQLPALLEAKMLAVSGNHFSTAKELAEEIGALTSERDGLEGLLARLAGLSARNVAALGGVKADYSRLQRELDRGKAAHEASVKEEAERYMDALESKLRSCPCPLLGRVWEADLEACRLLIQSLQPPEPRGSPSEEDEPPLGDLVGDGRTSAPGSGPGPHAAEDGGRTPLQASEERKAPPAPSPHRAASEQREEPHALSAELGEKCEAIGKKLLCLEDQLHTAMHSHDEPRPQSLRSELRLVKETLQAMILQLQPPREAGESEVASWATAGVREAQA
uniref:DISC1 scaffold protein n=1 Tax=Myotis lucifugus TaxID=59463 RepID=G1P4P4_MYOLU